jgi:hypothetical protein
MAVDIKIPKKTTTQRRFKITEETSAILDQYLKAAREANPGVDDDQVMEALLIHHFGRDKGFKKWCKEQVEPKSSATPLQVAL